MNSTHSWRRYSKSILALFFCCGITAVQAVSFMPVGEIKTGMEGHADTVITGDTISQFNVKVLGVMKDRGPSGDLILAKFSGPVMDKTGGIAHGMSGSPVYIDGRLVGAVAYGWGFADGTIGMITPIMDMVKLWNNPYEPNKAKPFTYDELIPLGTPLMAYGFDQTSLSYLQDKLPQYKYQPYATAAATGDDTPKPLVAGGSVAALLVDGDLKLGAIGTVTYVDKDRIVAFGHPFLKRGTTSYFMHNANIFTVVKSVESAFKLGSMGSEVGTVTEDRGAGIAGEMNKISAGIPMRVDITDLDTAHERKAAVKVVDDAAMTPTLASTAFYSFLNKTLDRTGEGTATLTYTITPTDTTKFKPFIRTNMVYSGDSISEKSVDEFYNVIDILMNNRFENYNIMDIQVKADITKEKRTAKIMDATASPVYVSPGDTIVVDVELLPFRGEKVHKEIFFKVPEDQPLGEATLEVRGGGVIPLPYVIEKQKFNLTDEIIARLRHYKDFNDLFKELEKTDQNNQIVVEFLEDGVSMVDDGTTSTKKAKIDGVEKNPLPSEIKKKPASSLSNTTVDDEEKEAPKAVIDTPYIVKGDGQFTIYVMNEKDKKKALLKRAKEAVEKAKMQQEVTEKTKAETKDTKEKKQESHIA